MIRRQIKHHDILADPAVSWNGFVDILATELPEELTMIQRKAQLLFWYDAEVNNGGHLQYFLNSAGEGAVETLEVLGEFGLNAHHQILSEALEVCLSGLIRPIDSIAEYIDEAMEGRFDELDKRYSLLQDEMDDFLESYLQRHFDEFIEVI